MSDYKIKCKKCGGRVFTARMLEHSKLYFLNCASRCRGVYLIGGREFPNPDDKEFIRKTILFRRFK